MDPNLIELVALRALADNVPHRIYAKDVDGKFVFANKAVAQGMGAARPDELIGRTDFDYYPYEEAVEYTRQEQAVLKDGQSILNLVEHARYLLLDQEAWLMTTKVPVRDEAGRIIGLVGINYDITAQKTAELALRKAHEDLQATVERLDQEVARRRGMEDELHRQSMHDTLTGLANRSLLINRLEHAVEIADRREKSLTLLFIDLDRFKLVNDSLGHASGDELLRIVTQRISRCVRAGDTFARLGGDEFVLLLPNGLSEDTLAALAERIRGAVAEPMLLGGHEVAITCSVGCCVFPRDGKDAMTLLKRADAAMYGAKESGGNLVRHYQPGQGEAGPQRLELEAQLKQALARNEFVLHYQPQVAMSSGHIVGVEALVRWQHPQRGLLAPAHFIPVAEESGLIGAIGEWVLRTALAQAADWRREGLPPLRMGVNLSARQFLDPALEGIVAEALAQSGLAPGQLELEVTESLSMKDPEETMRILESFHACGIGIAIDDFGTGYSNLAYLQRFPAHRVKLDRSFVSRLDTSPCGQAIVEAIVAMAHKLGLQIVAEGVETVEQRDELRRLGCDEMQGYWFSRPVEAGACAALLRRQFEGGGAAPPAA